MDKEWRTYLLLVLCLVLIGMQAWTNRAQGKQIEALQDWQARVELELEVRNDLTIRLADKVKSLDQWRTLEQNEKWKADLEFERLQRELDK